MLGHSDLLELTFLLALVLKLGAPPFQFWYLKIIQKLSWGLIWVLSIWQKLIPLILISIRNMGTLLIIIGGLRARFGRFGRVKQKKIKKVLGLSSIFSLGWVIISIVERKDIWLKFIIGYGGALICLILLLRQQNFSASRRTYQLLKPLILLILFLGLLIVRGVPPFIGFFLKVIVLEILMLSNLFLSLSLLLLRLLLIYTYLIIGFYLLTFIVVTTTTNKLTISQSRLLIDLVLLNLLVIIIFINIIYCKYYISNNKLRA